MAASFKVWHDGKWITIELNQGEATTLKSGGSTDEGYHDQAIVFTHCGDHIEMETHNYSRDCDGCHEYHQVLMCPIEQLQQNDMMEIYPCEENEGIFTPEWVGVTAQVYDQFAEAAGY